MEIIKIFIFGLVACVCMHAITFFISKNNQAPEFLIKFRWIIFILLIIILFLLEDYSNFITPENKIILVVVNIFISYAFISGIKKR